MKTDRFLMYELCPICGSASWVVVVPTEQLAYERKFVIKHFQDEFIPNSPDYMFKDHAEFTHTYAADLVQCNNCKHITRNPRLSPSAALKEYSQDNYHPEWLEASYKPYCDLFLHDMPRLIKLVGEKATVLEVGSQVGGFQYAAATYGWKIVGVDVGRDMATYAQSKGHIVIERTLEEAELPSENFDAVFVWNCFEMLPDPWGSLNEIYRILRSGGSLFITVPNGSFIKGIQPMLKLRHIKPLQLLLLKTLAYDILAGFSFQYGYTKSSILYLLLNSNFDDITVNNLHYVPVSSEEQLTPNSMDEKYKLLKITHYIVQAIYYLSFRKWIVAPWIEVQCRKPIIIQTS